jgi:hypothetical protein
MLRMLYPSANVQSVSFLQRSTDILRIMLTSASEIKPGENVTNFVDGVIDSSRYYAVRLKVWPSLLTMFDLH